MGRREFAPGLIKIVCQRADEQEYKCESAVVVLLCLIQLRGEYDEYSEKYESGPSAGGAVRQGPKCLLLMDPNVAVQCVKNLIS